MISFQASQKNQKSGQEKVKRIKGGQPRKGDQFWPASAQMSPTSLQSEMMLTVNDYE
jgi:hypothetical protein